MTPFRPVATVCVLLVLASAVAGCGDTATEPTSSGTTASETTSAPTDTPTTPSDEPTSDTPTATTPAVPDLPACDEVWAAPTLPRRYLGCLEGDTVVEAQAFTCSFGGVLVLYRNHYAQTGRRINTTNGPATRDPGYGKAIRACAA